MASRFQLPLRFSQVTSSMVVLGLSIYEAHPYLPYLIFSIEGALSLFYLGGFVALAVFLSHQQICTGATCIASQADAVFAALTYVLWAASATIRGIEISEFGKRVELTDEMNEKEVEEV
ncbi:hypothetical protein N431DRAFT_521025 [Stipitochalara longipes BDJ]|nr:hypothetical protein N431DRAFT_521025 [Stipitochalara longipes BDJ]